MNAPSAAGAPSNASAPPALRPRHRRRRILLLLAVLGVASAASLAVAEIAVRTWRALTDPDMVAASQQRDGAAVEAPPGQPLRLGHLIRAARNRDIVFELLPDLDVEFLGVRVETNAFGFRGPPRTREKPPGTWRIVGLGDSVLFGWGVNYEDAGLAKLEQLVQKALPTRVIEAIGTGVPGYNTAMEAQVLREKGLPFSPDLVIVDFVGNDLDLPNYLWRPPNYWRLDHSFLVDLVRDATGYRETELHGPFEWAPARGNGAFESDPARVPAEYRHLVGPAAFRRAIEDIAAMGKEHGFPVLVTCHHLLWPEIRDICAAVPVPVVEIGEQVNRWLAAHGHKALLGSPLTIAKDDPHPSPLVHQWWAEAAFAKLSDLGWLPR